MRHERDLVFHGRHPVMPYRQALLWVRNLQPSAWFPGTSAERVPKFSKLGFRMEPPDG